MEKQVSFYNSKKQKLSGILYIPKKTPAPAVVITHGFGSSKNNKKSWANFLCKKGFLVLLFDFNSHGESQGNFKYFTMTQALDDLKSAVNFIKKSKYSNRKIGLAGHSFGGQAIAIFACKNRIDTIITVSSAFNTKFIWNIIEGSEKGEDKISKWRKNGIQYFYIKTGSKDKLTKKPLKFSYLLDREKYNMERHAGKIRCPILILHGDRDEIVPFLHAKLYKKYVNNSKLKVMKESRHNLVSKKELNNLYQQTAKWFEKYLN